MNVSSRASLCTHPLKRLGFTLVELAIVMAVVGLMIGGFLVGADLVRTAELSSVISEVQQYQRAIDDFQQRYDSLPGDMPDATAMWAACVDDAGPPVNDCNGDGDGSVGDNNEETESFRAWQHLSLSGLVQGNYSGLLGSGGDFIVPGDNIAEAAVSPGLYAILGENTRPRIVFGQLEDDSTIDNWPMEVILAPSETARIDEKIDDGLPTSGRVLAWTGWETERDCYDAASPPQYSRLIDYVSLTGDGTGCMMMFKLMPDDLDGPT